MSSAPKERLRALSQQLLEGFTGSHTSSAPSSRTRSVLSNGWSDGYDDWSNMAGGPAGERLLPHIIEDYAAVTPERVWVSVACTADVRQGFFDVTFAQLARCVNHVAWQFEGTIGRSNAFETIAYMGNPDFRYLILVVAAMKCGFCTLLPSSRNSPSGNYNLLQLTGCTKFFYSEETMSKVLALKEGKSDLEFFQLPSFDEMLHGNSKPFPYEKTFWRAIKEPAFICQTSGSTALPKPIKQTNGLISVLDSHRKIPKIPGRRNQDFSLLNFRGGGRYYSPFPPFHVAGILGLIMPLLYNCTVVLTSGDRPPTGEMVSQIMEQRKLRALYCPPTVFEELIRTSKGLEQLSELDLILFTGGPLSPDAGNQLAKRTTVCQVFGSTETGTVPSLVPTGKNWPYFEWHPIYQLEMQEVYPGSFEMVIPRNEQLSWIRTTWHTFPELEEWRTRDLFKKHPEDPNLWSFQGRSDDVVVLSNGEMFNPVAMEGIIKGHPLVSEALVVGTGRFQAALLIEPKSTVVLDDSFISQIWPAVEEANAEGPGHARIFRSKIIIASPEKPFRRTAKNTIIRRLTTDDYVEEIEAAYSGGTASSPKAVASPKLVLPLAALQPLVQAHVVQFLPQYERHASDSDFYALGLDSLQTIELASGLKAAMAPYLRDTELSSIDARIVYAHANVASLSQYLHQLMTSKPEQFTVRRDADADRVGRMSSMVEKYTRDLLGRPFGMDPTARSDKLSVVLTGSTGTLGTNILRSLLVDPKVAKVYCMNRSTDALQRHEAIGLKNFDLSSPRIEFIKTEFGHPQFGLAPAKFAEMKSSVNVIIHNAWQVDFNLSLESFESVHIRGVRHLIDWALSNTTSGNKQNPQPHILFVSSIGSVGNWNAINPPDTVIPETPLTDYRVAVPQGYSESKHVSERILQIAAERCGLSTSILRVGQICGPSEPGGTVWNKQEWLPTLIQTSKTLGYIPSPMSDVDWFPVDALARTIRDIAHTYPTSNSPQANSALQIFNLVNPHSARWEKLVRAAIQKRYPHLQTIPLAKWVDMLKKSENAPDAAARLPAIKLIDFYNSLVAGDGPAGAAAAATPSSPPPPPLRFDTTYAQSVSPTMSDLGPVRAEWMELWLDQWNF